jgi:hypothetical protein
MLDVMPLNEDILGFSNRWYAMHCIPPPKSSYPTVLFSEPSPRHIFSEPKWKPSGVAGMVFRQS